MQTTRINGLQRHEWTGEVRELATVWRLTKPGRREMRCYLTTHPYGWDLRLDYAGELLRTQACRTQNEVLDTAEAWRRALEGKGWALHRHR